MTLLRWASCTVSDDRLVLFMNSRMKHFEFGWRAVFPDVTSHDECVVTLLAWPHVHEVHWRRALLRA